MPRDYNTSASQLMHQAGGGGGGVGQHSGRVPVCATAACWAAPLRCRPAKSPWAGVSAHGWQFRNRCKVRHPSRRVMSEPRGCAWALPVRAQRRRAAAAARAARARGAAAALFLRSPLLTRPPACDRAASERRGSLRASSVPHRQCSRRECPVALLGARRHAGAPPRQTRPLAGHAAGDTAPGTACMRARCNRDIIPCSPTPCIHPRSPPTR